MGYAGLYLDEMIKRRFYKVDHGDRDDDSEPSSSSDSELEAEATEESDGDAAPGEKEDDGFGSTSSGNENENSSANDVDADSSGFPFSEDDAGNKNEKELVIDKELSGKHSSRAFDRKTTVTGEKEFLLEDVPSYVLKFKSVFKCRICPRIICLTEDTMRAHLKSKGHDRSVKLLSEGRLKAMLNSDDEIENQDVVEMPAKSTEDNMKKKHKGGKQCNKRLRKKKRDDTNTKKMNSAKSPAKRMRKNEN